MRSVLRRSRERWEWAVLLLVTLVTRLYLLRVYDVELSQDGFDGVKTLDILRAQGPAAVPRELIDRFILHPLYMLVLAGWRLLIPQQFDFYLAARLLSTLFACAAVILLFQFTSRAFGKRAAWVAALLLAFAPTFLWESVAILSSTLFLCFYLAVLLALLDSRFRLAACLAFLAATIRYEGMVLLALTFVMLALRDLRPGDKSGSWRSTSALADWAVCVLFALAFPVSLVLAGWVAAGNPLEFLGAQSMASIWLRFLAPSDFAARGAFFLTNYGALFPAPVVLLGVAGIAVAAAWHRVRGTALLLLTSALYLVFFEALVWFGYTTLETRFLIYPGLPLLPFAGLALAEIYDRVGRMWTGRVSRAVLATAVTGIVVLLFGLGYEQGNAGMRFVYNMMASQREMADRLAAFAPANVRTNLLAYTGTAGALDLYGRKYGLELAFTDFRYAPDQNPEQFLVDRNIQFVIYPVGNAFAQAKYPYLADFVGQTRGVVQFQPLAQFRTSTDNQLYSIWSVKY